MKHAFLILILHVRKYKQYPVRYGFTFKLNLSFL